MDNRKVEGGQETTDITNRDPHAFLGEHLPGHCRESGKESKGQHEKDTGHCVQ